MFGIHYEIPDQPYDMASLADLPGAVAGLEYCKALNDCRTSPESSNGYISEGIDAFRSRQVAMRMNFAFTWPGFGSDTTVRGGKTRYFVNPKGPDGAQFGQEGDLGGVLFAESGCGARLDQVVRAARREGEVVADGRLFPPDVGNARAVLPSSQHKAQTFLDNMTILKEC